MCAMEIKAIIYQTIIEENGVNEKLFILSLLVWNALEVMFQIRIYSRKSLN